MLGGVDAVGTRRQRHILHIGGRVDPASCRHGVVVTFDPEPLVQFEDGGCDLVVERTTTGALAECSSADARQMRRRDRRVRFGEWLGQPMPDAVQIRPTSPRCSRNGRENASNVVAMESGMQFRQTHLLGSANADQILRTRMRL